jgi:aryl-alcohol dehydrogenase-like predicted oxidoreductase
LASGLLTGKYNNGVPDDSRLNLPGYEWLRERLVGPGSDKTLAAVKAFGALAKELGTSEPRLALAWCLKNPNVSTVITGASRVEQVVDNMQALDAVPLLTDDVMTRIDTIFSGLTM